MKIQHVVFSHYHHLRWYFISTEAKGMFFLSINPLAVSYYYGTGCEIDHKRSFELFKEGEEKGLGIEELEEDGMGRRENCQRCNLKIPSNADLALGNWGVIGPLAGKATFVEVFTETGADVLGKVIDAGLIATEEPNPKGVKIRENVNNFMLKESQAKKDVDYAGTTGDIIDVFYQYEDEFSKCMKCYGCREACPLCFCEDCCLEAEGPEWVPGGYTPAAPFFHLTRMVHMVDACTNCGQCSDVCPCEIPVSKVWSTVNNKVREIYGYIPGMGSDDPLPFTDHVSKAKWL